MKLNDYESSIDGLLSSSVFGMAQPEKAAVLATTLGSLHAHHREHCAAYQRLTDVAESPTTDLSAQPYLAVRLFKMLELKSISDTEIFKTLTSSGTTGQVPARIYLDRDTSARQSKVLVKIMQDFIGRQRLPMLIIDSPAVLKTPALSARGAGVQGMMFFGRDHTYALNEDMSLNVRAVKQFCEKYSDKPVLIFGFTFMVWQHFIDALKEAGESISLKQGILIHSGGWKKLIDRQVDNATFKATVSRLTGISKIHNFYGMAEQVGSVFVECEQGHLHAPVFADVIIRDPSSLQTLPHGETGLVQVLSALPTSYPGHSLLTEDMGTILGEDDCACGRKGRYFSVAGRLPKAEVRGCSDTGGRA